MPYPRLFVLTQCTRVCVCVYVPNTQREQHHMKKYIGVDNNDIYTSWMCGRAEAKPPTAEHTHARTLFPRRCGTTLIRVVVFVHLATRACARAPCHCAAAAVHTSLASCLCARVHVCVCVFRIHINKCVKVGSQQMD